jgi:hypothetical protein
MADTGFVRIFGGNTDLLTAIHICDGTAVYGILYCVFDMAAIAS